MNLKETYLAGHKACGLKVGDKVTVLRKADGGELGWRNSWNEDMSSFIGNICEVFKDALDEGFVIYYNNYSYYFPWFVLEKVEEEQKIKTSDLDFGCQQQNIESLVQRIINYIDKEK